MSCAGSSGRSLFIVSSPSTEEKIATLGDKYGNLNQIWLILGFRVLAEECAGCDHRTPV